MLPILINLTSLLPSPNHLYTTLLHHTGAVAIEDISTEDIYLAVPLGIIMDSHTASLDPDFGPLILALRETYKRKDDFHELLLYLLYERLVKNENSRFWPYLRLLPVPGETDPPTAWSLTDIRERLQPSFVGRIVEAHVNRTEGTYNSIKKVKEIANFFPIGFFTFENYRWAGSILDSRSIWWDGLRHLVPMLDFINCAEGPDPKIIHSTKVEGVGSAQVAVTKAGKEHILVINSCFIKNNISMYNFQFLLIFVLKRLQEFFYFFILILMTHVYKSTFFLISY